MECVDDSDNANDILNSARRRAAGKVIREHSSMIGVAGYAHTINVFKHFGQRCTFFIPRVSVTHVLISVFPQVAEEDVGTATSGDRAEFFSVTNQSDNTNGLKLESISPDRQHHFWPTSNQLCRTRKRLQHF